MAIAYFIFWVFTVNIFFCSSWFVAYIYTFSSKQSSKMDGENAIKSSLILLKNVVFESYLPRWRPHACEILALYFDSLLYVSFFSVLPLQYTYENSHPNIGPKMTHCMKKNGHILLHFWSLISKMRVTCMSLACFTFSTFPLNGFFLSSLVMAYICTFPSWQRLKKCKLLVKVKE